jgi:hypothetical protein
MTITLDGMRWFHQAANERIAKAEAAKAAILALPKGSRGKAAKLAEAQAKVNEEVNHRNEIEAVVRKAKQPIVDAKVKSALEQVAQGDWTIAAQVVKRSPLLEENRKQRKPFSLHPHGDPIGVYCSVSYDEYGYPQYIELRPRATVDEVIAQAEHWSKHATSDDAKADIARILAKPHEHVSYGPGISVSINLKSRWYRNEADEPSAAQYGINMSTCTEDEDATWARSFNVIKVADMLRNELNQAALPAQKRWYYMLRDINVDVE